MPSPSAPDSGHRGPRTRVYHCPRCHARNLGEGDLPPACAACGLPLGPEDALAPTDTRGRASWLVSLGVVVMLGSIVWQQRHQLGNPGLGLGAMFGLDGLSAEDLARGRSAAIHLCSAMARSRLGSAFDDAPFDDASIHHDADGGFSIRSRPAGADSLPGLTHTGFACRVRKLDTDAAGWQVTEFTVGSDQDRLTAPSPAPASVSTSAPASPPG